MTEAGRLYDILSIVLREMRAYGAGWRVDWSDFDCRQLRSQLGTLANWAEEAVRSEEEPEFLEGTRFLSNKNSDE